MKPASFRKALVGLLLAILFVSAISSHHKLGFWLMVGALIVCGTILVISMVKQLRTMRQHSKYASLKFLATLMGFFLVVGTGLYIHVFTTIALVEGHQFYNGEYLFRSLICSLDLFMLDVDSNILDSLKHNPGLKTVLSIQAVVSFSCTVLMLVGLVYSRLHAYYKLAYKTKINNSHSHLYIFFGVNSPSETLIKDIKRNDSKAVIVLIDEARISDDDSDEWQGIVGIIGHRHSTFSVAENLDISMEIATKSISDIAPDNHTLEYLGLNQTRKLISALRNVNDPQLHIFFLSDSEEQNVRNIITLAKDPNILEANNHAKLRIYCHARYNGPNRVIEDVAIKKGLDIKIVDSSHLAVERLKLHPELHPYNVMEFNPDDPATVTGPFNALIVGFGEVGRDAFKFLYEFGAFVRSDDGGRATFNCTIVDQDMDRIAGTFKASMPAIFHADSTIRLHRANYNDEHFNSTILTEAMLRQLNYIVVAINDADEAIALAARLFYRVRRAGGDLKRLRILVRCTLDFKLEAVKRIADHYNMGYDGGEDSAPIIRIFGQPEETYTYDLIVSDTLIALGKQFHARYRSIKKDGDPWDERHRKLMSSDHPQIDALRKLRRQESQDIANALHMHTKLAILRRAMPESTDWAMFYAGYFDYDDHPCVKGTRSHIRYPGLSAFENKIILRLAQLEHLRWNAAHELMGYVRRDDGIAACDETTMRHNCLKSWGELDAESDLASKEWACDYKLYDFAVVDTTIYLSK